MANVNVVVADALLPITVVPATTASSPMILYPPPRGGGAPAVASIKKKCHSPIEHAGGWTHGLVESMKASSPTHAKAAAALATAIPAVECEIDHNSTWMVRRASYSFERSGCSINQI